MSYKKHQWRNSFYVKNTLFACNFNKFHLYHKFFRWILIFVGIPPVKSLHIHILLIVKKLFVRLFIMPFFSDNWKVNQFYTFEIKKIFLNMVFHAYNLITKRITGSLYSLYKLLVSFSLLKNYFSLENK